MEVVVLAQVDLRVERGVDQVREVLHELGDELRGQLLRLRRSAHLREDRLVLGLVLVRSTDGPALLASSL